MQVTRATASQPGYGVPPLDPSVLTDPSHGQANLAWGLRYEAARAKSAGLDLSTPAGRSQLLGLYNGGGDPSYAQHVQGRMGAAAPAPMTASTDIAYNDAPAAPQGDTAAASVPSVSYSPPPIPAALQQSLNDGSGLTGNNMSRDLIALGSGLLQGHTLGQGIGLGGQALLEQRQQDQRTALEAYQLSSQQALYGMQAQRYGGQLGVAQQNADTRAQAATNQGAIGHQNADTRAQAVTNQGAIGHQNADTRQQAVTNQGAIGADNAATNRYRAQSQAANLGAPPPPSLPGTPASAAPLPGGSSSSVQQGVPGFGADGLGLMGPGGGAPQPTFANTGTTPPPGMPAGSPGQAPSGPPQGLATAPSAPPPVSPTGAPSGGSQGPSTASPGGLFSPPPSASSSPPASTQPAQLPGMGASGLAPNVGLFPMAGSNYDGLQGGLMARRQTQALNQKTIQKETDADTGLLEGYNQADTVANDQKALLTRFQQEHPDLSTGTGWWGNYSKWLTTQTNDPIAQELDKNSAAITQTNYPHGVGQLRVAELKTAATLAPGMGQSFDAANHLIDQGLLQRAQMRQILQGRQQWVNQHPNESPDVGYDPIANDWQTRNPAYVEGQDGKVQPGVQQPLLAFARAHVDPQTGRYVAPVDPVAAQAGAMAFPSGAPQAQSADPVAAATGAKAFPQTAEATPAPAQPAPTGAAADPATLIRQRLAADPQFRARAVQQRGQAWVQSFEGGN